MFLICIWSRCCDLIQVLYAHAWTGLLPHYTVWDPLPTPDQCMHWLADKLVFVDKWITSETTHGLVTLTNGVRVWLGREEGVVLNECRKRGGGETGWGFQIGHAEEVDFQVGPTGRVWLNRKWQGAFEGLDTEHINLVVVNPPQQVSQGIHHIHHGQVRKGTAARVLCEASVGTSRQCSAREVTHLSATPCMQKQTWSWSFARSSGQVSRQTDCAPLSPFPPDTCMIALICPDSIQPGVLLDFKCQTSVIKWPPHAH